MANFLHLVFGGCGLGAVYSLIALGLVLIHRATRIVNFAQGAFAMIGAYVAYEVVSVHHLPYVWAYVIATLGVGLVGVLLERLILRRMRAKDPLIHVMVTVFVAIAVAALADRYMKGNLHVVDSPLAGRPFSILGAAVSRVDAWNFVAALIVTLGFVAFFARSSIGRGLRAVATSRRGAELCGYSVDLGYSVAWFAGAALGGLAGVMIAPVTSATSSIALDLIAPIFVAAVLGGLNSFGITMIAAVGLGVAETLAAGYISTSYKTLTSLVVLFGALWIKDVRERVLAAS